MGPIYISTGESDRRAMPFYRRRGFHRRYCHYHLSAYLVIVVSVIITAILGPWQARGGPDMYTGWQGPLTV